MYEVEQKYRVPDQAAVRQQLDELGAAWEDGIRQVDRYFAHPCRDFARTDEALRIRQVDDVNCVTYKGPKIDATTKTRRELELPLPGGADFAQEFAQLLTLLGFEFVAAVSKVRCKAVVTWQGGPIEVVFDHVDGLGGYIELELMSSEAQLDAARARLTSLGTRLGLHVAERRSYLELLQEKSEST